MRVLVLLITFLPSLSFGQSIERQVIASCAINGMGSMYVSSTIGQPEYGSYTEENSDLTEGFEQPFSEEYQVEYELSFDPCAEGAAIEIVSISGCDETVLEFYVNEQLFDVTTEVLPVGQHIVTAVSSLGCIYHIAFMINEEDLIPCELEFYNLVTPNEDSDNDVWYIDHLDGYEVNTVTIFNRWGQEVWKGDNYDNVNVVWNGNATSGDPLPSGTYFYQFASGELTKEAFIELVR